MSTPRPKQSGAERAAQRVRPPGEAGLANEVRPGLGTRTADAEPAGEAKAKDMVAAASADPQKLPKPPLNRPAPREQRPDSFAHEQERDTGAPGLSGIG